MSFYTPAEGGESADMDTCPMNFVPYENLLTPPTVSGRNLNKEVKLNADNFFCASWSYNQALIFHSRFHILLLTSDLLRIRFKESRQRTTSVNSIPLRIMTTSLGLFLHHEEPFDLCQIFHECLNIHYFVFWRKIIH